MQPAPSMINGAKVLAYAPIDGRHRATDRTTHIVAGPPVAPAAGLAICRYPNESEVYLFGCDEKWQCVTDTWHLSFEDAKSQAEFEYAGTSETWVDIRLG